MKNIFLHFIGLVPQNLTWSGEPNSFTIGLTTIYSFYWSTNIHFARQFTNLKKATVLWLVFVMLGKDKQNNDFLFVLLTQN